MTDPIEREDTDHGVAPDSVEDSPDPQNGHSGEAQGEAPSKPSSGDEAPMTERPGQQAAAHEEHEAHAHEGSHVDATEAASGDGGEAAEAVDTGEATEAVDTGEALEVTGEGSQALEATGEGPDAREALEDEAPTSSGVDSLDPEATVNLTGDFDATVNLTGGTVSMPGRDDGAAAASEVTRGHLKGLLEALVFASDKPIKAGELAKTATAPARQVKELLEELKAEYGERGMQLDEVAGGWIFRTNAAYAPFVRDLTKQKPVKLTRAQIETLAILAYRQPITRPEIDDIRGVDCGPVLKLLLERDLVRVLGKKDEPGRPWLYGTTTQFLEFFGLKSLRDLPTLREFTDLNEESRRTVERELGETLETSAEERGAVARTEEEALAAEVDERAEVSVIPSDTLPPSMATDDDGEPMNTEIPPPPTSGDVEEEGQEAKDDRAPPTKTGDELNPEDEFPDDDDSDFDEDEDEDEDEDDEDEDEDEAEEESEEEEKE